MFLQDVVWLHISAAYDSTWGSCTNLSLGCVKHLCCHRKFIDQTKHSCVVLACCCRVRFVTTDLLHMMLDDWPWQKYQSEILIVVATQQIHETTNIWCWGNPCCKMCSGRMDWLFVIRWLDFTKMLIGNVTLLLRHTKLHKSRNNVLWKCTCRGMCYVFMDWLVIMLDDWVPRKYQSEMLICCWDTPNCTKPQTFFFEECTCREMCSVFMDCLVMM